MPQYSFTRYFEIRVLSKRPYVSRELCIHVIEHPARVEVQTDQRLRFWGFPPELGGRALRVVTLADGVTIHNAFLDRSFRRQ